MGSTLLPDEPNDVDRPSAETSNMQGSGGIVLTEACVQERRGPSPEERARRNAKRRERRRGRPEDRKRACLKHLTPAEKKERSYERRRQRLALSPEARARYTVQQRLHIAELRATPEGRARLAGYSKTHRNKYPKGYLRHLYARLGMTVEQVDDLLRMQENKCAICRTQQI